MEKTKEMVHQKKSAVGVRNTMHLASEKKAADLLVVYKCETIGLQSH